MSTPRTLATDIAVALAGLEQPINLQDIRRHDEVWQVIKKVVERTARAEGPTITLTGY